jgi:glycosyltransferase involved in cell wall biosynthesis
VSSYIRNQVLSIGKNYSEKVHVILNGIDIDSFRLENRNKIRQEIRDRYLIDNNDFVFLFTGRIEPNKGVYELIKAFEMINKDAKLMIVGGSFYSSNKKTKYIKELENAVKSKKDKIIFTGYIPHKEIAKYYNASDCMVVPSIWQEPCCLVNIEAFASDIPLISSDVGGTAECLKNTKALLVKKDNNFIDNLKSEMERIIGNKQLIKEVVESQQNVRNYFSKERYCDEIINLLDEEIN